MPSEACAEGFGSIFWCVGPKNSLEIKKIQEIKRNLENNRQGFAQSIRKYKKEIRQSKPS